MFPHQVANHKEKGKRQTFSLQEDAKLHMLVRMMGDSDWNSIAAQMENRTARQCRERYLNYLSPNLKSGPWTSEEDQLLVEKFKEVGPQWQKISAFFNHRSPANIKNRWSTIKAAELKTKNKEIDYQHPPQAQQQIVTRNAEVYQEVPTAPKTCQLNAKPQLPSINSLSNQLDKDKSDLLKQPKNQYWFNLDNLANYDSRMESNELKEAKLQTFKGYAGLLW